MPNHELMPFTYGTQEIRTLTIDDEPWFVAKDVCDVLEIADHKSSLRLLDDDEKGVHTMHTLGGEQQMATVNEPGLYSLILRSRKPEAKAFKRWITHEVLPQIRRTGTYTPQTDVHQMNATIYAARAQMELCQAARGLIHPDHLEAKARIILARGLGERPELDATTKPLYTQDYLRSKNLSSKKLRSVAGVFGKRLKAAYKEEYGVEPQKYQLDLPNGQVRDVCGYTERDRALMDRVWGMFFAKQAV